MKGTHTHAIPAKEQADGGGQPISGPIPAPQQTGTVHVVDTRMAWNLPKPTDPALIRLLFKEAGRRQHKLAELAQALGVTYGYLAQLRSGYRQAKHVSQDFAEACARYLGVPTALVKLWAGRIQLSDFQWPTRSRRMEVMDGLLGLREDPAVASWIPEALFTADEQVQDFVWTLYQEGSGIYPEGLRLMPTALELLERAALGHAESEAKLAEMRKQGEAA